MNITSKLLRALSSTQQQELLDILQIRFEKNKKRHEGIAWSAIHEKLKAHPEKLWSLNEMEYTGGDPDVVGQDQETGEYLFVDCAPESPRGRRSVCYDKAALDSRKDLKPEDTAIDMANNMCIELLDEAVYRSLQGFGEFDLKTSSWIVAPDPIRKLGGALFADRRYNTVFVYHNGASSYYAARGFRGLLKVLLFLAI